ncbi:ABC transporter permease [Vibrio metschnikovii]|uniref:FtsX-like permease family protein n=3 Tax=Bacteria TaxID=2 RepID=A0AAU6T035_UNCXX|nr:ABC transporter permease [Vibrio metschnikovii]EKO3594620.1 ABC transporter permease [Vibrio metschnikovii]EKO3598909.1 ABC transporter permease [Vibrio metschnikovii]EKO3612676.1 ABC transporter permease [Vibrio metschnikovii]EKO3619532.1 ABC transporter permease [Vibrio metschnikovii]
MLLPVVKALLGHYRRYPLQIFLVWLGLTLSVSLLVGVTAINHHAKQSYQHGEKLFANPLPYRIRPKHIANKIPQGFYVQLRREGFHQCVPIDHYRLTTTTGTEFSLLGIDPVAMLPLNNRQSFNEISTLALFKSPHPILVSDGFATLQGWNNGDYIPLQDGSLLGPLLIDTNGLIHGTRVVADLSLVRSIRQSSGLSVIACGDMPKEKLQRLTDSLPSGMALVRTTRSELESLTQAFHMNLTALGMLSFLVGMFIFYQAMSLSLIQRQPLVGILRQTGVSGWQLAQALSIELIGLILISWACGNVLGLVLANQLLPSVSASLSNLYDANVGLSVGWSWRWSSYSLLMATCAALASCAWPLIRLLKSQPIRLTTRLSMVRFAGSEFTFQGLVACGLLVSAIAIYQAPKSQTSGFVIITLMLLSAALLTPYFIWKLFVSFSYTLRGVKIRWFFADAAASMSYRGVATMAFMLAMTANIGVETMVGSFRDTTDKWLNQRLAADIYLYPTNSSAARMTQWLTQQPEVQEVWHRWEKDLASDKGMIQMVSTGDSEGERQSLTIKVGVPDYWYLLHQSRSVMISESMALRLGIRPGDYIDLSMPLGQHWLVVGVYYDYGNPYHQVMMSHQSWLHGFMSSGNVSLAVTLNADQVMEGEALLKRLNSVFRLNSERVFDNRSIHHQAMQVFDRTFAIADSLSNITLFIAVCGIFFATLAGEVSRQRHISLLRCLGVSGKELVVIGALQLLVFGLISLLIALPLGLALATLVIDVVIRYSFGWSIELQLMPAAYAKTAMLSMLALIISGALPVMRLVRQSAIKSLRDAL